MEVIDEANKERLRAMLSMLYNDLSDIETAIRNLNSSILIYEEEKIRIKDSIDNIERMLEDV